jgi:hypothetical protein
VLQFLKTGVAENVFDHIVTRTFVNAGCAAENVLAAWPALRNLSRSGLASVPRVHDVD